MAPIDVDQDRSGSAAEQASAGEIYSIQVSALESPLAIWLLAFFATCVGAGLSLWSGEWVTGRVDWLEAVEIAPAIGRDAGDERSVAAQPITTEPARPLPARWAKAPPPGEPGGWPGVLPDAPGLWLRSAAAKAGIKVTGLNARTMPVNFCLPSGRAFVVSEVTLQLSGEATVTTARKLLTVLRDVPCEVHVPTFEVWEEAGHPRLEMRIVLLGTRGVKPMASAHPPADPRRS